MTRRRMSKEPVSSKLFLPLIAQVVADQQQGQVRVGKQVLFHDVGICLIQGAGSFVDQQDLAPVDQGPRDGNALLLSA